MYKNEIKKLLKENERIEKVVIEYNNEVIDEWYLYENNDDFDFELKDCFEWLDNNFEVKSYDVKYNYIIIYVKNFN